MGIFVGNGHATIVIFMHVKIIGVIADVETIASGTAIRERRRLWKFYGKGRWRKLKVKLSDY